MKNELGWILESGIFFAKKSGSVKQDSNVEIEGAKGGSAQAEPDSQDGKSARDFTSQAAFKTIGDRPQFLHYLAISISSMSFLSRSLTSTENSMPLALASAVRRICT